MLEQYDKAWMKYRESVKGKAMPLLSWGQFSFASVERNAFESIQKNWKEKENLTQILNNHKCEVIVTNARLEIVFASQGIYNMNGYHPRELVGKSPKILQGAQTSNLTKSKIKKAISQKLPFKEILLNYKKDGTTYFCEIEGFPKFNKKGIFLNYIAFEKIAS